MTDKVYILDGAGLAAQSKAAYFLRSVSSMARFAKSVLRPLILRASCLAMLVLAGCASRPTDPAQLAAYEQTNDPLEPMNRAIFDFNDTAYTNVLFPVARAYRSLPDPVQTGIHNGFNNLGEPVVFMNKTLQGDIPSAGTTVARFLINTIFGFGGLIDVASHNNIQEPQAGDFGATLYKYGVGEGPYLVLPLLGPSNPRDTIGRVADGTADPWGYVLYTTYPEQIGMFLGKGVDTFANNMDNYEQAKRTSLDFYAFLRSSYRQNRRFEVSGGKDTGGDSFYDVPNDKNDHP
jgi:phospholipid-binding lipoprotein MlaA